MQLTIDEPASGSRGVRPQYELVEVDGTPRMRIHLTRLVRLEFDLEGAARFARRILMELNAIKRREQSRKQTTLFE